MGCNCQPQINHSALSLKLTESLKIMTFIFITFSVLKILFISSANFLNDILLAFILYALYTQLSYMMGYFAIFFIMIDFIFELLHLLQILQNIFFGFSGGNMPIVIIRFLTIVIYGFLLYLSFVCSREYKALFLEQKSGGALEEYQMFTEDFNISHSKNTSSNDFMYQRINDNGPKGYKPFSGQGQTWG